METSYGGAPTGNRNIQFYQNNPLASPQPHGPPGILDTSGMGDQSYLSGSEEPLYQSTPTKYGAMSKTNGFGNPYSLSPQQQQMLYGPSANGGSHPLHPQVFAGAVAN